MTVTSTTSRNDYVSNGATTVYPYTFRIFAATDLLVTETDTNGLETTLTLNVDYTVDGVLSTDGGNVTLATALAGDGTDENSHKLTIRRVLTATQPTDLRNQGKITAEIIERMADRITMLIQQLDDERARSLRLPESEAGTETTTVLPPLEERKGRGLYFDDTTGQPGAGSSILGTTVSAVMEAVVSAVTRQVAIDLLAGGVTNNRVLRGDGTHVTLGQIALADFANLTDARLLGRSAGSAGIPQELTVGAGLALAGGSLSASLPFWGRILNGTAVAHTGAGTLTVDRLNTVNLTSADATLSLPAAASNAGKVVGIKILATNTKCATIDGNASETIDGSTTVQMHKNGIMLIVSDGTGWISLVRSLAPGVLVSVTDESGQAVTGGSEDVQWATGETDSHDAWSGTIFTAPVDGVYSIAAAADSGSTTAFSLRLWLNGSFAIEGPDRAAAANAVTELALTRKLYKGDTAKFRFGATATRTASASGNWLEISRVSDA